MVNNTATVAHDVHTAEITQIIHTIIGYNNKNEIATKKTKFQAIFEGRGQKRERTIQCIILSRIVPLR